ncbi:MAG: hypothetical protein JO171_00535, partial [Paludibacterium sp.]|uniref:hypothetical protein n=1 Tax=Paludibacterium sp. TaxID=1917523 RepID=UPI0025F70449
LVIYPPDDRYPTYEANVQRAVWSPSCQAVMVYAFAEHFPASNSEKEVLAGLRSREKEVMAQPWAPTCQP